ncbi:MAG TPA: GNAT family N-acetyltransferase [Candidatus Paceibacterota bacterium]|nr:GNAT family N-acetyltransferase [Candidatus Paceibacterota bacterium]
MDWIHRPNRGSAFERATRYVRWLPEGLLLRMFIRRGYDGFLAMEDGAIIGHVFFQRHGDTLHLFSIETKEDRRRQGIGSSLLESFLRFAWDRGFRHVRLGAGKDPNMEGLWQNFRKKALCDKDKHPLPFQIVTRPSSKGWARLF